MKSISCNEHKIRLYLVVNNVDQKHYRKGDLMKKNTYVGNRKLAGLTILILLFCMISPFTVYATELTYDLLKKRLVADGFDEVWVEELYAQPGVAFETRGLSLFFTHREASLDYSQFLSKSSIKKAKNYLNKHMQDLEIIDGKYGVDKEVVVAIMLVETRLGANTGRSPVLNILSTMAALSDLETRDLIWKKIPDMRKGNREKYLKWSKKKSGWAYKELKAFLTYSKDSSMDPVLIKGSYAGALGIPQFMPSNISKFAKDGDQDGTVDLFTHADAMASIANYLKHYGWKPGLKREKQYKVILRYNYSKYYANTILDVAEELKG
jgi:peptidoglycan lytic transglycosylase B